VGRWDFLEEEREKDVPVKRALLLAAIGAYVARLLAKEEKKMMPSRVIEPLAHRHCYCYVEDHYLKDGQPVEVWRSILIPTTCEICEELDRTIISEGPWYGTKT